MCTLVLAIWSSGIMLFKNDLLFENFIHVYKVIWSYLSPVLPRACSQTPAWLHVLFLFVFNNSPSLISAHKCMDAGPLLKHRQSTRSQTLEENWLLPSSAVISGHWLLVRCAASSISSPSMLGCWLASFCSGNHSSLLRNEAVYHVQKIQFCSSPPWLLALTIFHLLLPLCTLSFEARSVMQVFHLGTQDCAPT